MMQNKDYYYKIKDSETVIIIPLNKQWFSFRFMSDSLSDEVKEKLSIEAKKKIPDFDITQYTAKPIK